MLSSSPTKPLVLVVAVTLSVFLSGCGKSDSGPPKGDGAGPGTNAVTVNGRECSSRFVEDYNNVLHRIRLASTLARTPQSVSYREALARAKEACDRFFQAHGYVTSCLAGVGDADRMVAAENHRPMCNTVNSEVTRTSTPAATSAPETPATPTGTAGAGVQ